VVLDSALRIPLDSKLVKSAREDVLVCTVSNDMARIEELRARGVRVEILEAENGQVPLVKVLGLLGSEGVLTLLTETGSRLNTALLGAGLVDRLQLFVSSQMMGADAVSAFGGMGRFAKLGPVEVERLGEDLGIGSLLRDPWPIP
jgi:diaminohydroxyphosphoribosylaminopyrimidine deaminase/5-amino-6-(5-phosphoribosylamino)uracil reductase